MFNKIITQITENSEIAIKDIVLDRKYSEEKIQIPTSDFSF